MQGAVLVVRRQDLYWSSAITCGGREWGKGTPALNLVLNSRLASTNQTETHVVRGYI